MFCHLHLHSEYSLLDGACRITDIPAAAAEAGQRAVALTDHGVMYGAVAFYNACRIAGVKPILGCEVYVAPRTRFDKTAQNDRELYHLILLVKNETGYKNLIYMVSKAFTEGFYSKPRIDLQLLSCHSEGLVALSACLGGYIPQCILRGDIAGAERYALELQELFGEGSFYLELQNHGLPEQKRVISVLAGMSERLHIPMAATNDVHYIKRSDSETQAVLMCIQTNSTVSDGKHKGFETDELYFKSTDEMEALFGKYPGAIENTGKIADMCDFSFDFSKLYLPRFEPENGISPPQYLRELAYAGLAGLLERGELSYTEKHPETEYTERIEYELSVIISMGYAEYYLIVGDFVGYARRSGIPTGPGRGSGASSLVAYLIGITEVDSVKFNLLFEAFLNKERISMPDFDIDFCYNRRDEVIRYVTGKYGADRVSQIVTFGTLAARAAIRDVGRALGMAYAEVDSVAKLIPRTLGVTLADALSEVPALRELRDGSPAVAKLLSLSLALEGMPRHTSIHAAGVVITDKPVSSYVPLAESNGVTVTQFDMDTLASLGLLKFDFLALRYLTIISDTEAEIKETGGDFDGKYGGYSDSAAYGLISRGQTSGVFQLESNGMKQMLTNMRPVSLYDIMVALALYRPGPMDIIPKFLENRKKPDGITYRMPVLAEILDETCGCIVYQEQVMQIFRTIAGYSYGKADIVRRAISKKKAGVVERERESFVDGAAANGYSREAADGLYNEIVGFANYGFKKSHAAAYAMISYKTAYLKANYKRQYFAALMTSVLGDAGKVAEYILECEKSGIRVLPPDINESGMYFRSVGDNIRFGLLAIKNVGEKFLSDLIAERKLRPFASFVDFVGRMAGGEFNRRQTESLIKAGCFDSLGVYRSRLLSSYDKIITETSERKRRNLPGQLSLFSAAVTENAAETDGFEYPDIPELSRETLLQLERESAGMYFSGHLLDGYGRHISRLGAEPIRNVLSAVDDAVGNGGKRTATVAGIVSKRVNKSTKSGKQMAFVVLEDRFSEIELVVFPDTLEKYTGMLTVGNAVSASGEVSQREDEPPKLLLRTAGLLVRDEELKPPAISEKKTPAGKRLFLRVGNFDSIEFKKAMNLIEIFDGVTETVFYNCETGKYMRVQGLGVCLTETVYGELCRILGAENVVLK